MPVGRYERPENRLGQMVKPVGEQQEPTESGARPVRRSQRRMFGQADDPEAGSFDAPFASRTPTRAGVAATAVGLMGYGRSPRILQGPVLAGPQRAHAPVLESAAYPDAAGACARPVVKPEALGRAAMAAADAPRRRVRVEI